MAVHFNIGELFWQLCRTDNPDGLWKIIDRLAISHPLYSEEISPEEILRMASSIALYGAGKFSEAVIDSWGKQGLKPDYCIDSDDRKWGTSIGDIQIIDPRVLFQNENPPLVVIAAMATNEIEEILEGWNIPYLYAERDGSVGYFSGHWLSRHRLEFDRVYCALSDDESRHVLLEVVKARMFQRYHFPMRGNYFSAEVALYPQYFREDIFTFSEPELFVDCGAFDGDTLIAFAAIMQRLGRFQWSAVALEVDKQNVSRIQSNLMLYGVDRAKIICAAVGKDNSVASSSSYFNCQQSAERCEVQSVSLDKVLLGASPTFIKMDIEGYEVDALAGAKEIISACHPKLAICSYHTSSQLLEVPLFILDNFPNYRLYIRHHSAGTLWETVCYAATEKNTCNTLKIRNGYV